MLFLMEIAWLKYRLQLPGFELPEALPEAEQDFSLTLAQALGGMAGRIEGGPTKEKGDFEDSLVRLERQIRTCCSEGSSGEVPAELETFQSLSSRLGSLTIALDSEI